MSVWVSMSAASGSRSASAPSNAVIVILTVTVIVIMIMIVLFDGNWLCTWSTVIKHDGMEYLYLYLIPYRIVLCCAVLCYMTVTWRRCYGMCVMYRTDVLIDSIDSCYQLQVTVSVISYGISISWYDPCSLFTYCWFVVIYCWFLFFCTGLYNVVYLSDINGVMWCDVMRCDV